MPIKPSVHVVLFQVGGELLLRPVVEAGQGLALVRSHGLRAEGHLIRTARQSQQLAQRLLLEEPKVVFLQVERDQVSAALALIDQLRPLERRTAIIVGGVYGTLCCHEFTPRENVAGIILGEWVEALWEFSLKLAKTGYGIDVDGMLMHGVRGWMLNEQRTYRPALEDWPDPDLKDFRAADIAHTNGGAIPIHASRGFPFQSLFSDYPIIRDLQKSDFHYYMRPAERVVAEAEALRKKYRVRRFEFVDEVFPWTGDWTQEFVEGWRTRVHTPFRIRSAAEYLTEDRLLALRQAKLERVEICIDGADEENRRRFSNLNQTNDRVLEAIELLRTFKIESSLGIMVGVPGESFRSLRHAVKLARKARATRTRPEIFHDWPETLEYTQTERTLTGGNAPRPRVGDLSAIARDTVVAQSEIHMVDSLNRAKAHTRADGAALDGLADFAKASIRSPYEGAARLQRFFTPAGIQEVIALRVPAQISWNVKFPENPTISFGVLLRPEMPGERTRLPVSFSIRVKQNDQSYRIFQKILIQSLDPDSRRWHWFRIPVSGVRKGDGKLILENLVFGETASFVPPEGDVWAGWGRLLLASREKIQEAAEEPEHGFDETGYH